MAKAAVYYNGQLAGVLSRSVKEDYHFIYDSSYIADPAMPPISLSFPKSKKEYQANYLFPFFDGLLTEGINKDIQCRLLKIDENDDFTRLLKTAGGDTIGAISIKELKDDL